MPLEERHAPPVEPSRRRYVFEAGDRAMFVDRKGRKYLLRLERAGQFQTHLGGVPHEDVIGRPEGSWVKTAKGHSLLAVKPTMADFTLNMPRIATVVYPKDLGAVLVYGDIFPGARVVEAGAGSGALTITLLRAVGESGCVVSYDVRADMIERASANVSAIFPTHPNLTFKQADVYEGIDESGLDRIVLDLPEPWHVAPHASESLVPGGLFLSFLPTVLQVHELTQELRRRGTFQMIETFEVLHRTWSVTGRSVRPSQQMVGHTGFITTARRCAPRSGDGGRTPGDGRDGDVEGDGG
jgi:tRNA (adenine57-N1/adenine58-N1)-methyltransferase